MLKPFLIVLAATLGNQLFANPIGFVQTNLASDVPGVAL